MHTLKQLVLMMSLLCSMQPTHAGWNYGMKAIDDTSIINTCIGAAICCWGAHMLNNLWKATPTTLTYIHSKTVAHNKEKKITVSWTVPEKKAVTVSKILWSIIPLCIIRWGAGLTYHEINPVIYAFTH